MLMPNKDVTKPRSSSSGQYYNVEQVVAAAELSEAESDASSVDMKPPSPASREQIIKRMESLTQENRVLKIELESMKIRVKTLTAENKLLREASVQIQVRAEQEEEFISNTLLKKIQELKKEKEALALNYEQEEECLTNDLSRKLCRLRQEKEELTSTLHQEQESLVAKLLKRIKKLEAETNLKQQTLDQLRREKVELENTLEQEQEALVNRLWKRLDTLEAEKQFLQRKLEQPITAPPSPMDFSSPVNASVVTNANSPNSSGAGGSNPTLFRDIIRLRNEVMQLRHQLKLSQTEHAEKTAQFAREEQQIREENNRLRRCLQKEMESREQILQNLSESESSLDIEDERLLSASVGSNSVANNRKRSGGAYSPMQIGICFQSQPTPPYSMRPISPANIGGSSSLRNSTPGALFYPTPVVARCPSCGSAMERPLSCSNDDLMLDMRPAADSTVSECTTFVKPANPSPASSPRQSNASSSKMSIPKSPSTSQQ